MLISCAKLIMRCITLTMVHVHAYYRMEEDFYINFVTFMHKFVLANFSGDQSLTGDVSAVDHWRTV